MLQRPFVQKSEQQLRLWHSAPELLMSPTLNAFGEPLCPESDDVLSALLCLVSGEDDIQREALKALVQACLDILHSQLGLFLTNPEPSADIIKNQYVRQLTIWHLKEPWVAWIKCFAVPQSLLVVSSMGKYGQNLKCTQWLESQEPSVQDYHFFCHFRSKAGESPEMCFG